ncbi:MAG: hypothetical protein V4617_17735 [Gemmatimonadota bacterium]
MSTRRSALRFLTLAALFTGCRAQPSTPSVAAPAAVAEPLVGLPAALHGARLPDQIADSTFWRMVREFSEPGGYFQSENFVSNEMGLQEVVSRLRPTIPPGSVYVGVGPEQNFTYFASLKPRIAFIVDIRRQNLLQHLWYKAVFELSPTRAEFLSRLFARPISADAIALLGTSPQAPALMALLERTAPDSALFNRTYADVRRQLLSVHKFTIDSTDLATLAYVDSVFYFSGPSLNYSSGSNNYSGGGGNRRMPTFALIAGTTDENGNNIGFLGSDSAYRYVRDLQRRNLVIPVTGNFSGPQALRRVGAWMQERGARLGTFYVSNVEQYLFRSNDDWRRFYENVGTIPMDMNSRFIRSTSGGMRAFANTMNTGPVITMTQLISPVDSIVQAARSGRIFVYQDVINWSR